MRPTGSPHFPRQRLASRASLVGEFFHPGPYGVEIVGDEDAHPFLRIKCHIKFAFMCIQRRAISDLVTPSSSAAAAIAFQFQSGSQSVPLTSVAVVDAVPMVSDPST